MCGGSRFRGATPVDICVCATVRENISYCKTDFGFVCLLMGLMEMESDVARKISEH